MNKLEALKILIEHSFLLSEEVKTELLLKIYNLDEEKINILGRFLAQEKKKAIESSESALQTYDELIKNLESEKATE